MSVDYSLEGDIAVVTLSRPDRYNAVDPSLSAGLVSSLDRAGEESRAVILTGAGRAFCSGADLNELKSDYEAGNGPDLARLLEDVFHPALDGILGCPVPVVAAINGVAAGAGLGIALACDLRVMSEEAYLAAAFTAIGLVPDSGTTWWLSHHLGVSRALELTLTNRRVPAQEAMMLGLCLDVVPGSDLLDRAKEVARGLTDLVADSLVTTRRLIHGASASTLRDALVAEQAEQGRLGKTAEHREGVIAFMEKRDPDFRSVGRQGPAPTA